MNEDLEKLIQGVPGVVYRFRISADGDRRFLFLSEGVRDLYGCSPQEGCEKIGPMLDCVLEEDRARLHDTVEQSRNQLTPWFHEFRIRSRSGDVKWIRGQSQPAAQEDGSVIWSGLFVDVSHIKNTELQLLRLQKMYRAVMEVHQHVSRPTDLEQMYHHICRTSVELGGMKMAWIGVLRADGQKLAAAAKLTVPLGL